MAVSLLAVSAVSVVATGAVAERAGQLLGSGSTAVTVWDIAKWPVIAVLVSLAFALLYWAAPNVRLPGFRWLSPGGILAVLVWVLASAGFALYVANFGSYNKTYGSLAGVIVFLVWRRSQHSRPARCGARRRTNPRQADRGRPIRGAGAILPPRDTRAMDH